MAIIPARLRRRASTALTAAATELPTGEGDRVKAVKHQDWQHEVMEYFHTVPELKFAGRWVGEQLSKVRMFVAVDGPDDEPIPVDAVDPETNMLVVTDLPSTLIAAAIQELDRLDRFGVGGIAGLQRSMAVNLDFPGECFLIGWAPRPAIDADPTIGRPAVAARRERWELRSIAEVVWRNRKRFVLDGSSREGRELTDDDTIIRMWQPDEWDHEAPDSNVRSCITECRLLQALSGQMYAETNSRIPAGAITVPKGLTTKRVPTNEPVREGDEAPTQSKFILDMTTGLTRPAGDPADFLSQVPFIIEGERDDLKADVLRRVDFGRDDQGMTDAKIDKRIERIGHGLNMPIEVLMGHRDTTYANAKQVSLDEFNDYLDPRAQLLAANLTEGFLTAQLRSPDYAGFGWTDDQIDRLYVWRDPTPLLDKPDPSDAADEAFDRFAIGWTGYRKLKNIPEDMAPDGDELLQLAGLRRGILTAELTGALLERVDETFDFADVIAKGADAADTDDDAVVAAAMLAERLVDASIVTPTAAMPLAQLLVSLPPDAAAQVLASLARPARALGPPGSGGDGDHPRHPRR